MQTLLKQKTYSVVSALLLLSIGICGFAFRGLTSLPDYFLFLSLILGFWGLLTISHHRK